ncbi:MAG: GTPase HflX [Paludibacteraceae bacterium]|nr:GTPase HflX [Paludibacteraceae bacterium]
MIEIKEYQAHAVLVALITPTQPEDRTREYLDELAFLADTNKIVPVKRFTQRLDGPNSNTFVGEGKLQEIKDWIEERNKLYRPTPQKEMSQEEAALTHRKGHAPADFMTEEELDAMPFIDAVIFDDELSPRQIRNIERELGVQIIDRTMLILQIFLQRAQTSYAKTQVEMARLEYMLPRLTRLWSHLDRQRGGGTANRGTGETQIEADRRIIKNRLALLRDDLKKIDRQMNTQRQNRGKMIRVALVGYTNVGKSTLMNLLSKSEVFAENKLFATLDTTVRKVTIDNLPFLLSDTVGFIRKLPHNLVESFKSTLDEVREADLLMHIVDISHPNFEEQYQVVEQTIQEICCADPSGSRKKKETPMPQKPEILVFNKIDAFTYTPKAEDDLTPMTKENLSLEDLEKTWMARLSQADGKSADCIFISAKQKDNIDALRELMYERVKELHIQRYPYNDFLFQKYE